MKKTLALAKIWLSSNPGKPLPEEYTAPYLKIMEKVRKATAGKTLKEIERREKSLRARPHYGSLFKDEDSYGNILARDAKERVKRFATPSGLSPSEGGTSEAEQWLIDNPNDPRAPAIRKKLGL